MKYLWIKEWGRWPPDCPFWQSWWASHFWECASSNAPLPPLISSSECKLNPCDERVIWIPLGSVILLHFSASPPPLSPLPTCFPCLSAEHWGSVFCMQRCLALSHLYSWCTLPSPLLYKQEGATFYVLQARNKVLLEAECWSESLLTRAPHHQVWNQPVFRMCWLNLRFVKAMAFLFLAWLDEVSSWSENLLPIGTSSGSLYFWDSWTKGE